MSRHAELNVAQIVSTTRAEGPGLRYAIWLQGCPLRCPGCCNPEMLPFVRTSVVSIDRILCELECSTGIEGISLLGGEPFAQAADAGELAAAVQLQGLSVMVFSGFTLEQLCTMRDPAVDRLLEHTDLLVDGPYLRSQPDTTRRWVGSENQQVHFFSERYQADDACWQLADTLEIRFADGELKVNGFPAPQASGVWKRLKPTNSSD